ncbi:MAG TPA: adenylate/guanylate cyclase domain-containing protein [Gaiellaceae bacterium]
MRCAACGQENPDGFRFCGNCGAPLAEAPAPRELRKTVTVVFCDLTGSTALGDSTDPEALRTRMLAYYEQMRAILERHGGTVEKFIGDAVMAVFGVPVAHEDDALRAVRAAWEMRAAVPGLGLAARIGVNTGEVVTGDGDTLVTGDAVNVAARLEQAAAPGEVLIGAETRRLVRDAVAVEPVTIDAKGKGEVAAFRLGDLDPEAAAIARRFDLPLVGRRVELGQLRQAFERAVHQRRCHLFTLLGPAGVGKSRLVDEFLGTVDAEVVEGRCLDYGEGITYWPVIAILKQLGERAEKTLRVVVDGGTMPNEVPWTVRTLLEEVAQDRPLVVVFDDIQWGEDTFLDLVDHVADLSRGAPILLLCVARPELLDKRPGWGGGKLNAATILLEPLGTDECLELIGIHGGVDDAVRDRILAAAGGNPLFVEEMVALVHEDGSVGIPSTVQALLQARIDQLAGDERSVIERGAVEGEIFHRGAVAELARPADVDPQLVGLVRKELIHPTRATLAGDQAFRFRHLLIRDAAYDALPKSTRAELHERFAEWLEVHGRELVELDEIVGYHLERAARYHDELGRPRADLAERAGRSLAAAARRAAAREDIAGALKLLTRAIALLPDGTPDWEAAYLDRVAILLSAAHDDLEPALAALETRPEARLRMQARIVRAMIALNAAGDRSGEAATVARDATPFFEALGDHRGLAAAAELEATLGWLRCNAADTAAAASRFMEHAALAGVIQFTGRSNIVRFGPLLNGPFTPAEMRAAVADLPADALPRVVVESTIAEREGRLDEALAAVERSAARLTELGVRAMVPAPLTSRALILRRMGRLTEAVQAHEEVLALERALGLTSYLSTGLIDYAETRYDHGDLDGAERLAVEGEHLGGEGDVVNFSKGRSVRARVEADRGNDEAAVELARSACEHAFRTDFPGEHGRAHETLAHVHQRAARIPEARAELGAALATWERYGWAFDADRVRALLAEL